MDESLGNITIFINKSRLTAVDSTNYGDFGKIKNRVSGGRRHWTNQRPSSSSSVPKLTLIVCEHKRMTEGGNRHRFQFIYKSQTKSLNYLNCRAQRVVNRNWSGGIGTTTKFRSILYSILRSSRGRILNCHRCLIIIVYCFKDHHHQHLSLDSI